MKLRELLDEAFDETWVRIAKPDGKRVDLWVADYIGGYEPVMDELEPLLDSETDGEFMLEIDKSPETGKPVPIMVVTLMGEG